MDPDPERRAENCVTGAFRNGARVVIHYRKGGFSPRRRVSDLEPSVQLSGACHIDRISRFWLWVSSITDAMVVVFANDRRRRVLFNLESGLETFVVRSRWFRSAEQ